MHEGDGDDQTSPAGSAIEDSDMLTDAGEQDSTASLDLILRELREFRRDNCAQLNGIREEINKTNKWKDWKRQKKELWTLKLEYKLMRKQ